MKRFTREIISILLIISLILSITACSRQKDRDDILDLAYSYADALVDKDINLVSELSSFDDNSVIDSIDELMNFDEDNEICSFISDNISYEVCEDTVAVSLRDKTASIDIRFFEPDYKLVFSSVTTATQEELIEELEDADDTMVVVSLSLENIDGEWCVVNTPSIVVKLYGTIHNVSLPSIPYSPDDFEVQWWYESSLDGNNSTYVDVARIEMDAIYHGNQIFDYSSLYYTVTVDDEVIYTSGRGRYEGVWSEFQGADVNVTGYIVEGEYTITFYQNDLELCEGTATVTTSINVKP